MNLIKLTALLALIGCGSAIRCLKSNDDDTDVEMNVECVKENPEHSEPVCLIVEYELDGNVEVSFGCMREAKCGINMYRKCSQYSIKRAGKSIDGTGCCCDKDNCNVFGVSKRGSKYPPSVYTIWSPAIIRNKNKLKVMEKQIKAMGQKIENNSNEAEEGRKNIDRSITVMKQKIEKISNEAEEGRKMIDRSIESMEQKIEKITNETKNKNEITSKSGQRSEKFFASLLMIGLFLSSTEIFQ